MTLRSLAGLALVAVCLLATACQKLPDQDQNGDTWKVDESKLMSTVPLDYGDLIGVTVNSASRRWVTMYFQRPDKSIVIVGLDQKTWKVWPEPHVLERK